MAARKRSARAGATRKIPAPVAILGAGAQARETMWLMADLIAAGGPSFAPHCLIDDVHPEWQGKPVGLATIRPWSHLKDPKHPRRKDGSIASVVGVGSSRGREAMVAKAVKLPLSYVSLLHPSVVAHIDSLTLGEGTVVAARSVLSTDVRLGAHVLINIGCTISHDCSIGHFTSLAPGVHVAGAVKIGRGVEVGIGASIIPHVVIGDGVTVGAQSCVLDDVPDGCTVVGVPARVVKRPS